MVALGGLLVNRKKAPAEADAGTLVPTAQLGFLRGIKMSRWDLLAEVQNGYIVVRVPGTSYAITFHKPADSPQLLAKNYPLKDDHRAPMNQAVFLTSAWKLANDKARELGWII